MWRFRLARLAMWLIQVGISRLVVVGRDNIPDEGPYLVVSNHMSTADSALILLAFPLQEWRLFAGEKWQDHWLFGPLMSQLGTIYVNRDEVDRQALREALSAIEEGAAFGLAPEGKRSKVGHMLEAKHGAAYLAAQTGVPIVPVGITNSDILFANTRRGRETELIVRIGEPFALPKPDHRLRSRDLPAYTHYIMIHIAALVDPRHRGQYADSPALLALLRGEDPWPYCLQIFPVGDEN